MKPDEAWASISARLKQLVEIRAAMGLELYTEKELEAEVICFKALKEMEDHNGTINPM